MKTAKRVYTITGFRYYPSEEGIYISRDPIKLVGGNNLYGYVPDTNSWVDIFGLKGEGKPKYAPNEQKWENNGGIIDKSRGDNNWIYTDNNGNTVPYVNGILISRMVQIKMVIKTF